MRGSTVQSPKGGALSASCGGLCAVQVLIFSIISHPNTLTLSYSYTVLINSGGRDPPSTPLITNRNRRTIPKTTSGKIARALCKRAHTAGSLNGDTLFLWGETNVTPAAMDARAEKDALLANGPNGVEEAKTSWGEEGEGPRDDPREMTETEIMSGVRSEVAKILKAQASAIPTVSVPHCPDGWVVSFSCCLVFFSWPRVLENDTKEKTREEESFSEWGVRERGIRRSHPRGCHQNSLYRG